jgi:archaellum component FlaC
MIQDTPRTDAHNWKDGDYDDPLHAFYDFAGQLERELNAANAIIKQQQLLEEENLRLQERIKRLEETLEAVTDKLDNAWGIYMEFKEPKP